jgi:type II secretory pathway component PulM
LSEAVRADRPTGWEKVRLAPALWRSGFIELVGRYPVFERKRTEWGLWWGKRSPRERRLLLALGGTAALAGIVTGIYQPLAASRASALAGIHTYEVLISQLRTAGPELSRLKNLKRGAAPAYVSSSARSYGLTVSGLQGTGGSVAVSFQNADFVKVVQWLAQVENESTLRLMNIQVVRRQVPGMVDVKLVLRG